MRQKYRYKNSSEILQNNKNGKDNNYWQRTSGLVCCDLCGTRLAFAACD
ncbi:MAG: hypothetical protein LBB88_07155 [Planctomycetaceae bacterium]|nr:hypothetical protein [Planctomycetaceae bacterium]